MPEANTVTQGELALLVAVDPCTQDQDPGVGAVQLPRFFFNKNTKLCEDFIYFGSAGNRNNFLSLEECQRRCPGHTAL